MNQFYTAQLDVGASKQTLASAGFATPVAISRRRSRTSSASASTSTFLAGEDKGHDPMADPVIVARAKDNNHNNKTQAATLAENQRPMYAIPSEGWLKQPDSWGYASSSSSSEEANRQSMLLRQFPATWQSTRRLFGRYLMGSSASVDEDRASVTISGALDDPARSAWRSAGAGAGGAGEVVEGAPGAGALLQHTRSPSPPPLPLPPSVIASRRRLLSVAALTGADEPVYPVLSPPTTTSVASATAIPATRFYS